MSCVYLSVTTIPLGDALTLVYSSPLYTMIISSIVFGHRLRLYKLSLGLTLVIGIVLVVQPPFIFHKTHTLQNVLLDGKLNE